MVRNSVCWNDQLLNRVLKTDENIKDFLIAKNINARRVGYPHIFSTFSHLPKTSTWQTAYKAQNGTQTSVNKSNFFVRQLLPTRIPKPSNVTNKITQNNAVAYPGIFSGGGGLNKFSWGRGSPQFANEWNRYSY
jgi:hypothetical protein